MRLASCLRTNHRLDICPSEEWGEPRVALSLRHHTNERPVLALLQDRFVPELVTATGSGLLGGFTLFQVRSRISNLVCHLLTVYHIHILRASKRDLPTRTKRKLHAIGGARGLWSLPVRTAVKVNGVPYDRPANPYHAENDSLILGTDVIPSPGFSRVRMPPLSFSTARPYVDAGPVWNTYPQGGHYDHNSRPGRHCWCLSVLPRHCDPTCAVKCHPST